MAEFCLAAEMSPSEYHSLTVLELGEFIQVLNQRAK